MLADEKPFRPNQSAGFLCAVVLVLLTISAWPASISAIKVKLDALWGIDLPLLASTLSAEIAANHFPHNITLPNFPIHDALTVHYTVDTALQTEAQRLLRKYNPDYGVLVALDADSGQVLAMASSTRRGNHSGNISLSNRYPAASISKIITAVAAINENKASADTAISFNGTATSLYKKMCSRIAIPNGREDIP